MSTALPNETLHAETPRPGFHATLTRRPVGLLVIFLTLILIGVIAYLKIPLQLLPGGVGGTRLSVYVMHPGSSAARERGEGRASDRGTVPHAPQPGTASIRDPATAA